MRTQLMRAVALAVSVMSVGGASAADVIFGGNARSYAMGGAGLAIVDRSERNTFANPASLALYNRRVKFGFPRIGLHASGISLSAAYNHLLKNPSANDAVSLARDFGGRNSDYGASLFEDIRFGHLDAIAEGSAVVHVLPNAALQTWAKTANGDVTKLTGSERADLIGAAIYALPEIGVAERVSPAGSPTRVEAGARIKLMRAIYSHYIVSSSNIANNTPAVPAPELNGGTTITKDGVGVDTGILVHPRDHAGLSGAIVVTDLIEPNFRFNGTDQNGAPVRYDLQPRSVSVGSAYESGRMIFAADIADLTRSYSNVQGRFGVEYDTRKGLALQAGYNTASGFTAGFGYGFLQFAFGSKAPLTITEFLRF